jgi:hypothetical protein
VAAAVAVGAAEAGTDPQTPRTPEAP